VKNFWPLTIYSMTADRHFGYDAVTQRWFSFKIHTYVYSSQGQ